MLSTRKACNVVRLLLMIMVTSTWIVNSMVIQTLVAGAEICRTLKTYVMIKV